MVAKLFHCTTVCGWSAVCGFAFALGTAGATAADAGQLPDRAQSSEAAEPSEAAEDVDAVQRWAARLRSRDTQIRLTAAYGFDAGVGAEDEDALDRHVPALVLLLSDDDPFVRAQAAATLGDLRTAPSVALPVLAGALRDKRRNVRQQAALAMAKHGEAAVEPLVVILRQIELADEPERVRAERAGVDRDPFDLETRLDSHRWPRDAPADYAALALTEIGPPAVEPLVRLYRDEQQRLASRPEFRRLARRMPPLLDECY